MKKQYLFVANWKMHLPFNKTIEFATSHYDEFVKLAEESKQKIVICPSTESLYLLIEMFKSTPITIGAQNCSGHLHGSFTGQTSSQSLQEVGCSHCIIGHSEGRKELCETDRAIAYKCTHLLDYDVTPIVCIGESEQEHKNGQTLTVLEKQLATVFETTNNGPVHSYLTPYIAYEPIWSIGTGKLASIKHLDMVFSWLRGKIEEENSKAPWGLMYGGSISPQNIASLKEISAVDGFLIGKSSLDFQKLKKIVQLDDN